jgi:hypothetical protein
MNSYTRGGTEGDTIQIMIEALYVCTDYVCVSVFLLYSLGQRRQGIERSQQAICSTHRNDGKI